jgi:uncharacterized repeat protein (TIGR03803 family)
LLLPVAILLLVTTGQIVLAQTEIVLYTLCSLPSCTDGALPNSALILDSQGVLYDTTLYGGARDSGTAFKLTPSGNETVIRSFAPGVADGPAGLISDAKGNLYGEACCTQNHIVGSVFKLKKFPSKYGFRYLHRFSSKDQADGIGPSGGLVMDARGNLYGTTAWGGAYPCESPGCGIVFKVAPDGTETVLYNFAGEADGNWPAAGVILDEQGTLYGTTAYGGGSECGTGCGIVFTLTPGGVETILHTFNGGTDGQYPIAGLVRDTEGNLYGTTYFGGSGTSCFRGLGCGTVFKITPSWTETVLHTFAGGADASFPAGGLVLDSKGNLYGTTTSGGNSGCSGSGCGTVFKLTPSGEETILYRFTGGTDGASPGNNLILDGQGNLYGTAQGGHSQYCGYNGGACGVVFKITR